MEEEDEDEEEEGGVALSAAPDPFHSNTLLEPVLGALSTQVVPKALVPTAAAAAVPPSLPLAGFPPPPRTHHSSGTQSRSPRCRLTTVRHTAVRGAWACCCPCLHCCRAESVLALTEAVQRDTLV